MRIEVLVAFEKFERMINYIGKEVAGAAMRVLCDYSWLGNVRQLKNCVERLVAIVEGPVIHAGDLPKEMQAAPRAGDLNLDAAVQETEKATILATLAR